MWLNNAPIPEALCKANPELQKYGFYRRLDNGKFEFVSWCDPLSRHWEGIYDQDLNKMLDKYLPENKDEQG